MPDSPTTVVEPGSAASAPDVSVVAPVFGNRATLAELRDRVEAALKQAGLTWELLLVNDACPHGSGDEVDRLSAADPRVRAIHLPEKGGQQRALVAGIRASIGHAVVTLDADLQDPPEAIPTLIDRLGAASVVYAGRRGEYQSKSRHSTSRLFKIAMSAAAGTPRDGGAFIALDREAADAVRRFRTSSPFLPAMAGLLGMPLESVPVERARRSQGVSAYSGVLRLRTGTAALAHAVWWRLNGTGHAAARSVHNENQISYYGDTYHPNMQPHKSTGYVDNHIARVLEAAGVGRASQVLEIGAGLGRYTLPMAQRLDGLEVLELSPGMLADLSARAPESLRARMYCADASDPPDELLGRFDAVVGYFMLHHVHDLPAVFSGVARCLRPGGRAVFIEPNPINPLYYFQIAVTPGMTWAGDRGIVKMRPVPIANALAGAGLTDFWCARFGFWPPVVRNTAVGASTERVLERVEPLRPALPFQLFVAHKAEAS